MKNSFIRYGGLSRKGGSVSQRRYKHVAWIGRSEITGNSHVHFGGNAWKCLSFLPRWPISSTSSAETRDKYIPVQYIRALLSATSSNIKRASHEKPPRCYKRRDFSLAVHVPFCCGIFFVVSRLIILISNLFVISHFQS